MSDKSDFDGWTLDELLSFANGIGACEFRVCDEKVIAEKNKVKLSLRLGRFSNNACFHAGMNAVFLSADDRRDGTIEGWSSGYVTEDDLSRRVESSAKKLGMFTGQAALF